MIMLQRNIVTLLALLAILAGCKKDNYDPPSSILKGRVVYNKEALGLRSNGVQMELWQHGYQLFNKIPVYIDQDGRFQAVLFNGQYKLTLLRGNGPWQDNTDSIDVNVNGSTEIDLAVTPFFTVGGTTFSYQPADSSVTATFTISQVVSGKTLESATLYVGATQFVDAINQIELTDVSPLATGTQLTAKVSLKASKYSSSADRVKQLNLLSLYNKKYCYARIGVKTSGVAERIYSTVQQLKLP